ncbi:Acetylcholine receptor subunit alpha-like 2 [Trachymyrmex zeteki]|uniref:Acetylcholine receptor subunit alpha-like 2 n=1 Tax=Mycetomoellerius zeteki TaxID=64791 RepID=A0A151WXI7_9HYME|nr:PREDICTED: acetylcholine receptor subunit alpha-like 2 [Trachymyrmex zeteki]KYQ52603.1 Acetylcholine receptor subunit alpha-like 2 [Trachymyrmex zeteki]
MRILQVFGFFVILWHGQFAFKMKDITEDIVTRGCKKLENTTPLLRLKKYLFCDYDSTVRPNHHKVVTNITLRLMPKMMEFTEDGVLTLHSWMSFFWTDTFLTWTPSNYNGLTYIHVQPFYLWMPDIYVYNSGDMTSNDYETILNTECLVFNNGSVICVPPMKIVSKCDPDYTYWPYDQHTCLITLGSWSHIGEEIDVHLDGTGVDMNGYENNTQWDLKLLNAEKIVKKYKCCPNDTFPRIDYTFLLTRHYSIHYRAYITPAIALIFLTLTVLWLDSRSVERVAMASINFICHLLCIFDLFWMVPFNGVNSPYIMLFYRDSLMLATFALILTALLRKLQNTSMEMPSWISSTTTFILSNGAGRFLVLNDEESKIADGGVVTEDNSDSPKSETKKESWRHFAAIIEWLSFFCVILTYAIILITLVPLGATN